ncbi:MAG: SseB family protein [Actinobacteria bacterium]|nr:SseB family protein [Actinomycetota bacterium]MCG2800922.1 SseB family protein [Cellulomonas sp.]
MSGRDLPASSPFSQDDGSADPALARVLAAYERGAVDVGAVVDALGRTRVLVPVLAHPTGERPAGDQVGCHDETAGVVAVAGPDGRTALPVFTSVQSLARWSAEARPVPATADRAAASALAEGWPVLVLDAGGPVRVVIGRPAVQALAAGETWRPAVSDGVVDDEVADAVRTALHGVLGVLDARPEPGDRAELAVRLQVMAGLDRARLERVVARADAALAAEPTVAARVDSVELRVVR